MKQKIKKNSNALLVLTGLILMCIGYQSCSSKMNDRQYPFKSDSVIQQDDTNIITDTLPSYHY